MIKFSVKEVLQKATEEAKQPIQSKIVIKLPSPSETTPSVERVKKEAAIHQSKSGTRQDLLNELWSEYNEVLTDRKKLSTEFCRMVDADASKSELAAHYQRVDDLIDQGAEVYKKIQHVKQYGILPAPSAPSIDLLQLKDQRNKLVDLRCKLSNKIKLGKAKNPNRVLSWELELDQAEAEYTLIDHKIKKLEGKA
jgi:hypothetical protein